MKITNAHLHLFEPTELGELEEYMDTLRGVSSFGDMREMHTQLQLITPESVLAQMEEAGVSRSVLFACYAPLIYSSNEYVASVCHQHPDKFIGFASVQPNDRSAPEKLEAAIEGLGLRGLKFHPPLQDFYPNSRAMDPIYEQAIRLDIPVVFHVGTTPFGPLVRLDQANPILLDEVAVRFPRLKIVLTHLGTLWHNEAFMVTEKNPNVYIDTAAYLYEIRQLMTRDLVARVGEDKFVFGTDFPMPSEGRPHKMKDFVDCVGGLDLDEKTIEKIFHLNFERLIGG